MPRFITSSMVFLLALASAGQALEFRSAAEKTLTVELYTSEGCSSCPPADAWLSGLKADPRLFQTLLPLAFHVDYWNGLGWRDRFSREAFSARQRRLAREGRIAQVYTPGFVVDSREWRGWFHGRTALPRHSDRPGVLSVSQVAGQESLEIRFEAEAVMPASLEIHTAVLGMGLDTKVKAGENRGRRLQHDFVVLSHALQSFPPLEDGTRGRYQVPMPTVPDHGQDESVLAVWLAPAGSARILQAAAAVLPQSER